MFFISNAQRLVDLGLSKGGKLTKTVCGVTITGNMLEDIDAVEG